MLGTSRPISYDLPNADRGHEVSQSTELEYQRTAFLPDRLRMARELKGLTQGELAGEKVSAAAVSQYETGRAVPSADTLGYLAGRLGVQPQFLTVLDSEADAPAYFRSLRSTPAAERKKARHYTQLLRNIVDELEKLVRLPALDIPVRRVEPDDNNGPALAARYVREHWRLRPGPVGNVVREVERRGIVTAVLRSSDERVDAFSVPFSSRPIIVMSAAKGKRDRSRLDVAHELGHLVMHDETGIGSKTVERQANNFAAELLMPASEIRQELPATADWHRLIELKQRWQVSMAALLYRAKDLGVMAPETYVNAMKFMSARGWRRHEPADLGPPESPVLLRKALDAANVGEEELQSRLSVPKWMLHAVLPDDTDDRPTIDI
jgi:Zn-dependent peptidase ImmA (M78 family)/DNA-binding XRE family transcriptional regulator